LQSLIIILFNMFAEDIFLFRYWSVEKIEQLGYYTNHTD